MLARGSRRMRRPATIPLRGQRVSIEARAVEGLRIGGTDALSGQRELGRPEAQRERVLALRDKCDRPRLPGTYREAAVLLFQKAHGVFSEGFDHQASILIEYPVGSTELRE